jgi:hypothetical protein
MSHGLEGIRPIPRPVAQLIEESERRGQAGMVERARVKAETTPVAKAV